MSDIFNPFTVTLAAGEFQEIRRAFKDFSILSATNIAGISVSFDGGKNYANLPEGIGFANINVASVFILNTSGAPNTITVAASTRTLVNSRTVPTGGTVVSTVANGADVAEGAVGDAAAATAPGNASVIAILKRLVLDAAASLSWYTVTPGGAVTAVSISAVAGRCRTICVDNESGATAWLRLYDQAAAPGVGDTPFATIRLAAASQTTFDVRRRLTNGLGVRITAAAPDNDATNVAAGVHATILYDT